tara:strand:+ start:43 stop:543 length:501 start_codon:yes stop_codon:yes gene_type:complete
MAEPLFDAPIPGQGLTHELKARPWQNPPQYSTVDEAVEFYISRMGEDSFSEKLIDAMEMGIPLTTLANTIQLNNVMEGRHSVDIGILVMPVIIEMMRLIGDSANIEYDTGMDKKEKTRSTLIDKALNKLRDEEAKNENTEEPVSEPEVEEEQTPVEEEPKGLMARR